MVYYNLFNCEEERKNSQKSAKLVDETYSKDYRLIE